MTTEREKFNEVAAALKIALATAGHVATMRLPTKGRASGSVRFADGTTIELMVDMRGTTWWATITGSVLAGSPWRKGWREPKGGFRYAEMAAMAVTLADKIRAYEKRDKDRDDAHDRAERLVADLALPVPSAVSLEVNEDGALVVAFTGASDEQIAALVGAARACRLLPERTEEPTS